MKPRDLLRPEGGPKFQYYANLLDIVAALMLGGCLSDFTVIAIQRKMLVPWIDITCALTGKPPFGHSAPMKRSDANYIFILSPSTMRVQGYDLYLLDTGLPRILHYDRGQQTITPVSTNLSTESGISVYAAPGRTDFVT